MTHLSLCQVEYFGTVGLRHCGQEAGAEEEEMLSLRMDRPDRWTGFHMFTSEYDWLLQREVKVSIR
jgi:hypothetical protein